jgi:hypothetical protein
VCVVDELGEDSDEEDHGLGIRGTDDESFAQEPKRRGPNLGGGGGLGVVVAVPHGLHAEIDPSDDEQHARPRDDDKREGREGEGPEAGCGDQGELRSAAGCRESNVARFTAAANRLSAG